MLIGTSLNSEDQYESMRCLFSIVLSVWRKEIINTPQHSEILVDICLISFV